MRSFAHAGTEDPTTAAKELIRFTNPRLINTSLSVDANDDMYAFSVGITGHDAIGSMAYFRAGLSIYDTIERIAEWRYGSLDNVESFLDFAAGYGRSTRFLVQRLDPQRITVAEIQKESLAFQAEHFGVSTLLSETNPADLVDNRSFQYVFVASLFTHLPERAFGPWLRKLWEYVDSDGMLVFSVHDEAINDVGAELVDGFAFLPSTEVASLSTEDYGTNFTSEMFVRQQINDFIGANEAATALRLPRALCFMQDIWIVCKGATPAALKYECGPSGAFDELTATSRWARFRGWAADRGDSDSHDSTSHRISRVEVYVNGRRLGRARLGGDRPDVARHLGRTSDELLRQSGWEGKFRVGLEPDDIVLIQATCANGAQFVLDSTRVDDMLARTNSTIQASRSSTKVATARRLYREQGLRSVVAQALITAGNAIHTYGERVRRA